MGKTCDGCSKSAEDIYWSHFQFTHFYQILAGGCEQQLIIPKKFSGNLKKKLPSTVALKGPSGAKWDVGLTANDDALYFRAGWQEFVKAHSLEQNDLLVFRYNGGSEFDVLIFDWRSFCEKEASYFLKMCEQKKSNTRSKAKRKLREPSLEQLGADTNNGDEFASSENMIHEDSMERMIQDVVSKATNIKGQPEVVSAAPLRSMRAQRKKQTPANEGIPTQNVDVVDVEATDATPVKALGSYFEQYVSSRRELTDFEKNNALKLADEASTESSFKLIMRPSHVYRRFFLSVPMTWVSKHLTLESQDITLRIGNDEWPTKFNYIKSRQCGGLCGGWKHFATDNNLEEFDVCVFEPVPRESGPMVLEVKIFRVVEDVAPLTRVASTAARKSGRKLIKSA